MDGRSREAEGGANESVTGRRHDVAMAKQRRVFVCRECGAQHPSWAGRCGGCDGWATIEESARPASVPGAASSDLVMLSSFDESSSIPTPTGIDEVDRVLGGGFVPGSVTLLGGEPGIGKSTLSLQVACSVAASGGSVVVVTGEEAPTQVAARAHRLGSVPPSLSVIDDTTVEVIEAAIRRDRPQLVIVDSIQTVRVAELDGAPGSVVQVRAAANRLVAAAKECAVSIVLIGHVTKEGSLAGPRLLEHVVDTVLSFTGDRHNDLRFLRASKHRYGPTTDVGLFEMTGAGLEAVADPSGRFLADRCVGTPGSVVVPALDQQRPVLLELQALTTRNGDRPPNMTAQGVSTARLKLVMAVLSERAGTGLWGLDVFASAAGGATVDEPGADMALALAIASAVSGRPVGAEVVACGEIGLAGEIRAVPQMARRLQEAHRLGFRRAVVPGSCTSGPTGLQLIPVTTLLDAVAWLDPALAA